MIPHHLFPVSRFHKLFAGMNLKRQSGAFLGAVALLLVLNALQWPDSQTLRYKLWLVVGSASLIGLALRQALSGRGDPVHRAAGRWLAASVLVSVSIAMYAFLVSLVYDVTGQGTFVAHRVSGSSTNTIRPIYSWTVSGDDLPNGGKLAAGHYWLQFGFEGVGPQTSNVFVPLVTPRSQNAEHNARLFNVPFSGSPASWFEGREGFVSAAEPGRAYSLPFELIGTPEPTSLTLLAGSTLLVRRRRPN